MSASLLLPVCLEARRQAASGRLEATRVGGLSEKSEFLNRALGHDSTGSSLGHLGENFANIITAPINSTTSGKGLEINELVR